MINWENWYFLFSFLSFLIFFLFQKRWNTNLRSSLSLIYTWASKMFKSSSNGIVNTRLILILFWLEVILLIVIKMTIHMMNSYNKKRLILFSHRFSSVLDVSYILSLEIMTLSHIIMKDILSKTISSVAIKKLLKLLKVWK